MYAGKLVFAQVMEFALWLTFRRLVAKYRGDFNVRTFRCLDHFLSTAFAQLTYPDFADSAVRNANLLIDIHRAQRSALHGGGDVDLGGGDLRRWLSG